MRKGRDIFVNSLGKIQKNIQKDADFIEKNLDDLCASIQHSIITILIEKIEKAIKKTGIKELAIAGGVSANSYLRSELKKLAETKKYNIHIKEIQFSSHDIFLNFYYNHYSKLYMVSLKNSNTFIMKV